MIAPGSGIYLAARYSRRQELLNHALLLQERGYEITSTWLDGHHETQPGIDEVADDALRGVWAAEDWADLRRARWFVCFTEPPRPGGNNRGGRHVEFGAALAWGHRCVVIGPRETVFHCLPDVTHFNTWEAFLAWLPIPLDKVLTKALR